MWFCLINGQQKGPFSETQFNDMIAAGKSTPRTPVWEEGRAAWQPLAEVRSEFSIGEVCQVCERLVGADHLVDLNGARVCAACKPVVLQRMREGLPAMPPLPRHRPVMVWVISLFYFIFTPLGVLLFFLMPVLASSGLPMSEAKRHYFLSQNVFDYLLRGAGLLLHLAGAILLFRLRRQALFCFGGVFALMPLSFGYQIAFKHWQVLGSQPGELFRLVFSIGINLAIVWYVWQLKAKNVLR